MKSTNSATPADPDRTGAKSAQAGSHRRGFLRTAFGSIFGLGMVCFAATLFLWLVGTLRFLFPNVTNRRSGRFLAGPLTEFPPGAVDDRYQKEHRVWIIHGEYNGQPQLYALRSVCTHLGCTPIWMPGDEQFKCPCHGSGFHKDGVNFEGPAPRPLERVAIRLTADQQLEIDTDKIFHRERGEWDNPESFVVPS